MKEIITIENFGGIKFIEIEFKRINILIGPQAAGKSITVKLSYFFKTFFAEITKSITNNETKRQLDRRQIEKFINYFPKESWPKGPFKLTYKLNNTILQVKKAGESSIHFDYSQDLKNVFTKGKKIYREEEKKLKLEERASSFRLTRNIRARLREYLKEEISNIATYSNFFVPAGRSFFANIQSSIFSFLSDNRSLDPFLIEFGSFYESFKRFTLDESNEQWRKNEVLNSEILSGSYLREKGKDFLLHRDSRKVNLSNASSGQQETLPLVLVLNTIADMGFSEGGATLYIEEPEAHLFPTAQKKMVQLLARTFNTIDSNFQIIVTTHSPYILSSFNNLLEAGKIIDEKKALSSKVYKIVPKNEVINPSDLIAYSVNKSEKKILIDKETKLISQNILDSVSDEISLEFGKLLDIEY